MASRPDLHLAEYVPPNVSCLEPHRDEIALARKLNWPCQQIAELLFDWHGIEITGRAVAAFCRRRGIVKRKGETRNVVEYSVGAAVQGRDPLAHARAAQGTNSSNGGGGFVFRGGPMKTKKNGLLKEDGTHT